MPEIVVNGATCKCSRGNKPGRLRIPAGIRRIGDETIAVKTDTLGRIQSFGICNVLTNANPTRTPINCIPEMILLPWMRVASSFLGRNELPAVLEVSLNFCPIGGVIIITDSGQTGNDRVTDEADMDLLPAITTLFVMISKLQRMRSNTLLRKRTKLTSRFNSGNDYIDAMLDLATSQIKLQQPRAPLSSPYRIWMNNLFPNYFAFDPNHFTCITFVSWVLYQAGIDSPRVFNVERAIDWYREPNGGGFALTSEGATPLAGDTFFLGRENGDGTISSGHAGIVIAFEPPYTIFTVEDTGRDNVVIRRRSLYDDGDRNIVGFGRNGGTTYGVFPVNID